MNDDFTFSIIKPNAVKNKKIGPILAMINEAGFRISAMKMVRMTLAQAKAFYAVHKDRPFYNDLCDFMISGPIVVMILRNENAVEEFRKLIGNTDPEKAEEGTIRKLFAASLQMNAVHGSDSQENAQLEASFFFSGFERFFS
ncbi:MAG: nucleoside-diphosphate kinase [Marinilabiliaceae bacterium]|jgi:nucleoside-diphosphate kinase|nr:nucleoside-diphosphate kinase [Marinilabiliaceae bacterium]